MSSPLSLAVKEAQIQRFYRSAAAKPGLESSSHVSGGFPLLYIHSLMVFLKIKNSHTGHNYSLKDSHLEVKKLEI